MLSKTLTGARAQLKLRQKRVDTARGKAKAGTGVVTHAESKEIARLEELRDHAKKNVAKLEATKNSKNPLRVKALIEAKKDIGVHETQGNNWGSMVTTIIRANGGTGPEPWCGDAVAYWYRKAGSKLVQRSWASTIWLASHLTPVKHPMPGHIVVYNFGSGGAKHTGLFDEWIDKDRGIFRAVEGNTGVADVSDAGGGEGVGSKIRNVSSVLTFRRINA